MYRSIMEIVLFVNVSNSIWWPCTSMSVSKQSSWLMKLSMQQMHITAVDIWIYGTSWRTPELPEQWYEQWWTQLKQSSSLYQLQSSWCCCRDSWWPRSVARFVKLMRDDTRQSSNEVKQWSTCSWHKRCSWYNRCFWHKQLSFNYHCILVRVYIESQQVS